MSKNIGLGLFIASLVSALVVTHAHAQAASVDRMYVLECGEASGPDLSQWSPGSHPGRPVTYSNQCYLIQHGRDWLLWDTGVTDDLAGQPEGKVVAHHVRGVVRKTLRSQLHELGIEPDDINHIAFSHAHFDHVGNSRLFARAKWFVQGVEYDAMFSDDAKRYGFVLDLYKTLARNPVERLEGDHDVFGDGSVRIIATPGHTPGHQSLWVRLPTGGAVILSGDAAHLIENFSHRRVPSFNADPVKTRASIDKLRALAKDTNAKILVNHDPEQSGAVSLAPAFIE